MMLSDEQIQDLLRVGNPTAEECRMIRMGWDAALAQVHTQGIPDGELLQRVIASPYSMTRNDVIRLAREAGDDVENTLPSDLDFLGRFAALVAAAEREACAQLVEKNADVCGPNTMLCDVLRGNAEAIRARRCDAH